MDMKENKKGKNRKTRKGLAQKNEGTTKLKINSQENNMIMRSRATNSLLTLLSVCMFGSLTLLVRELARIGWFCTAGVH